MRPFGPIVLCATLLIPSTSGAFVPSTTCIDEEPEAPTQIPFCQGNEFPRRTLWPDAAASFRLTDRAPDEISPDRGPLSDELVTALVESFEVWNEPECSRFEFTWEGKTDTASFAAEDGENIVVFHDDGEWPYSSGALAVTSVTWNPSDADIFNADMELNSASHEFGFVDDGEAVWDIRNTVTHEAGHFLGLAHSPVEEATMQFDAAMGETSKRDLHPDDIEGLCEIYPVLDAEDPIEEPDGCCATTQQRPTSGALMLVLAILFGIRRRAVREHSNR